MWAPLVTDRQQRDDIVAIVREIVHALPPLATASDHAETALVRAYLARDGVVEDPDDDAGSQLVEAVTALPAEASAGLFGGAAGIGWIVEHVTGDDEVGAAIGDALERRLVTWDAEYDVISGLAGFGVYALERGDRGREIATRVVDQLDRLARPRGGGLAWFTRPELLSASQRALAPDGYWNLGLAHGVPGVIAMLARFIARGIDGDRARRLLGGAVGFVLGAEPPRAGRFPPWQPYTGSASRRLAWCYGDLGVSLALLAAATVCERADWRDEALALARDCAAAPLAESEISDACLCHGAAGAMHLFHRLYAATSESAFAEASLRWLDQTLALRRGIADASLLSGAAGVALALHAMIATGEPSWDRLLLVDV